MNYNFFESLDASNNVGAIWSKNLPAIADPPVVQSWLQKASRKNSSVLESGYFSLQGGYLLYWSKKEAAKPSSGICLKHATVSFPHSGVFYPSAGVEIVQADHPIQISLHGKFSVLYAESANLLKLWATHLSRAAFRVDFHERYSVKQLIGKGASACVYQVNLKEAPDQVLAVKGFNKSFVSSSSQTKLALCNEIYILRRLDHPNLLRLIEVHETGNSIYIVTELHTGGDLSKLIARGPLETETITEILFGTARALAALAEHSIAHRDLKPANIILRKSVRPTADDVVLADLGMACNTTDPTLIFKRCGTPGYIAPETISRKNEESNFQVTAKVDVYSLGCLAYALLTGRSPFESPGRTVDEIIKANGKGQVDFSQPVFGQYPSGLRRLVEQMLSVDPENRPSAQQVLADPLFEHIRSRQALLEEPIASNYTQDLEEFVLCDSLSPQCKVLQLFEGSTVDGSGSHGGSINLVRPSQQSHLTVAGSAASVVRKPYECNYKASKFSHSTASSSKDKTGSLLKLTGHFDSSVSGSEQELGQTRLAVQLPLSKFSTLAKHMLSDCSHAVLEQTGALELPDLKIQYSA